MSPLVPCFFCDGTGKVDAVTGDAATDLQVTEKPDELVDCDACEGRGEVEREHGE